MVCIQDTRNGKFSHGSILNRLARLIRFLYIGFQCVCQPEKIKIKQEDKTSRLVSRSRIANNASARRDLLNRSNS